MTDINDVVHLCISDDISTRVKAFSTLTQKLTSQHPSATWAENITADVAKKIINNLKKDLFNENPDVSLSAAGFLGYYLDNDKLMDLLSDSEELELFEMLISLLETTKEKSLLARALWSFSQSKFCCEIYSKNLKKILNVISGLIATEQSVVTVNEALQVIKSLMECIPEEMKENASLWFGSVFVNLFNDAAKIRSISLACLNIYRGPNPPDNVLQKMSQLVSPFVPQIKSHYCKFMSNLIQEDSTIFKIWRLLVMMLGKSLHPGTSLINGLLEVVEKAFKSPLPELRVEGFKCWHILISNFAADPAVLNHPKRLKLLVAPFKSNNAKTEDVGIAKLTSWWFLISNLGEKSPENFDLIVAPMLKFCFNSNFHKGNQERVKLDIPSPGKKYSRFFIKSLEMFARLLSHNQEPLQDSFRFSINSLNSNLVTPFVLTKNHQLLFGSVADALTSIDQSSPKQCQLGVFIMKSILLHIHSFIGVNLSKKEPIDIVKDFFRIFTELENSCTPGDSLNLFLFQFLELQIGEEVGFSKAVVNSRHYNIHTGSKAQDVMNGTLSNYFVYKLCRPCFLYLASNLETKERYFEAWSTVIMKSKPATGKLFFYQSIIEELNDVAQASLCKPSVLFSLWNLVCNHLDTFIKENHLIDQGNGNEADWSCIYKTLLFPILNAKNSLEDIDEPTYHKMVSIWSTVYQKFVVLTPLSVGYDPGCECDYIAKQLFTLVTKEISAPPDAIPYCFMLVSDILFCLVDKFKFSELGRKPPRLVQSPAKVRKKPHLLHNLGICVELLGHMIMKAMQMVSTKRQSIVSKLCLTAKRILENVSQEKMIWPLVSSFLDSLQVTLQVNPSAKFNADVEGKVTSMWKAFCSLLEHHIAPKITYEQLSRLSPLFVTALQSSHSGIRKQMESLWVTKLASTTHPLPNPLMEALKEAQLPPASISDTPFESSQNNNEDNSKAKSAGFLALKPRVSLGSPKLNLGKDLPFRSPLRSAPNQRKQPPKQQSLEDMKEEVFVKVVTTKSKRILTPHQQEKMKERAEDIPAMYNDLSQSTSQFSSQFMEDTILTSSNSKDSTSFMSKDVSFRGKIQELSNSETSKSPSRSPKDSLLQNQSQSPVCTPEHKSHNDSYSDKELDEELRRTSFEFEKSFSDSIVILQGEKSEAALDSGKENRKSLVEHKRKAATPSKKSIEDIRKVLKGGVNESRPKRTGNSSPRKSPHKREEVKSLPSQINQQNPKLKKSYSTTNRKVLSPLGGSFKSGSPHSLSSTSRSPKSSLPSVNESESEDELPNTQPNEVSFTPNILGLSKYSPNLGRSASDSSSRPKRNKRKNNFDSESIYSTPTKRSKLSASATSSPTTNSDKKAMMDTVVLESDPEDSVVKQDSEVAKQSSKIAGNESLASQSSTQLSQSSDSSTSLITPTKVTRSGRKIIPPNKDMPEPMTPSSLRKKPSFQESDKVLLESPKARTPSPSKIAKQSPTKVSNVKNVSPSSATKIPSSPKKQNISCNEALENQKANLDSNSSKLKLEEQSSKSSDNLTKPIEKVVKASPEKLSSLESETILSTQHKVSPSKGASQDASGITIEREVAKKCDSALTDHTNSKSSLSPRGSRSAPSPIKVPLQATNTDKKPKNIGSKGNTANKDVLEAPLLRSRKLHSPKILRSTIKKTGGIIKTKELPAKKVKKALKMCKSALDRRKNDNSKGEKVEERHSTHSCIPVKSTRLQSKAKKSSKVAPESEKADVTNKSNENLSEKKSSKVAPESEKADVTNKSNENLSESDLINKSENASKIKTPEKDAKIAHKDDDDDIMIEKIVTPNRVSTPQNVKPIATVKFTSNLNSPKIPSKIEIKNQAHNLVLSPETKGSMLEKDAIEKLNLKRLEDKIISPIQILKSPNKQLTLIKIQVSTPRSFPNQNKGSTGSVKPSSPLEKSMSSPSVVGPKLGTQIAYDPQLNLQNLAQQISTFPISSDKTDIDDNLQSSASPKPQLEQRSIKKFLLLKAMSPKDTSKEVKEASTTNKEVAPSTHSTRSQLPSPTGVSPISQHKDSECDEKTSDSPKSEESMLSYGFDKQSPASIPLVGIVSSVSSPLPSIGISSPISAKKVPRNELAKRLFEKVPVEDLPKSGKGKAGEKVESNVISNERNKEEDATLPKLKDSDPTLDVDAGAKPVKTNILRKKADSNIITVATKAANSNVDKEHTPKLANAKPKDDLLCQSPQQSTVSKAISKDELTANVCPTLCEEPDVDETDSTSKRVKLDEINKDDQNAQNVAASPENSKKDSAPKVATNTEESQDRATGKAESSSGVTDDGEKSPDKSSPSKFSSTIGTPERKKLSMMKVQVRGSRAAIMLACAKKAMKTRGSAESDSSNENKLSPFLAQKSTTFSTESPSLKRKHIDLISDDRPWAKHKPSPDASPANSILKKRPQDDELMIALEEMSESGESPSTSASKSRRVSFADPPVSESVEIPRAGRSSSRTRAQKRLDMTQASCAQLKEAAPLTNEINLEPLNCFEPIYQPLLECQDPIENIAPDLTSPTLVEALVSLFKERGCLTVGKLCEMTEAELHSFPVRSPKTSKTLQCLTKYSEKSVNSSKHEEKAKDAAKEDSESPNQDVGQESSEAKEPPPLPSMVQLDEPMQVEEPSGDNLPEIEADKGNDNTQAIGGSADFNLVSEEIEDSPSSIEGFVNKLTANVKSSLFKTLAKSISYDEVIDIFHEYLKNRAPKT